ncbi:MAG TPA: hypothetical protein ENG11_02020, partial [candidate division Zixibacteria bacterium]|nr:hypothetical protein [candidate division Zixibacteria bacterium]
MNAILTDSRWNTGLYIGPGKMSGYFYDIIPYPPFTDGVDFLYFDRVYRIYAWEPAYYVVVGVSAMSNPERLDGVECPCENGGRIFVLGDCHQFDVPVVGYFDTNDHRYMANVVLGLAGILEVPDCSHPQVPEVINIPCGDPGDYAVAYGSGFSWVDSVVIPGDGPVPFTVIDDSTMEIFVPDSFTGVQTYLQVRLYYLHTYVTATIQVYCVWLSANFEPYCLNPGDTLYFTGSAFDVGISSITINGEPVETYGGSFGATSDSTGWLYLPTTPPGGPRYVITLTLSDTRSINRGFRIPCPTCIDVSPPFTIELEDVWFWEET